MRKSDYICAAITVVLLGGAALLQLPGREAAAQAGGVYVNAVDLDIMPGDMPKFLEAVKENGANAVKEPRVQHPGPGEGPESRVPLRGV